jgi:hypothetical protein
MKRTIIESPYAGHVMRNLLYAEFCCYDSLMYHKEAPIASHLIYTRDNILRDDIKEERDLGIQAGFAWREVADISAFYIDLGTSLGMTLGIEHCINTKSPYDERILPFKLWGQFLHACGKKGLQIPERQ